MPSVPCKSYHGYNKFFFPKKAAVLSVPRCIKTEPSPSRHITSLLDFNDAPKETPKEYILETEHGIIPIEDTVLVSDPYKDYKWDWNNTLLSLVWSYPCVKSIVTSDRGGHPGPVNLSRGLALKRFLEYDESFLAIDSTIDTCSD